MDTGAENTGRDHGVDTGTENTGRDHGVDTGTENAGRDHGVDTGTESAGRDHGVDIGAENAGRDAGGDCGLWMKKIATMMATTRANTTARRIGKSRDPAPPTRRLAILFHYRFSLKHDASKTMSSAGR